MKYDVYGAEGKSKKHDINDSPSFIQLIKKQ